MKYTIIINNTREIVHCVDYVFMDQHRVQLVDDTGTMLKEYDKKDIIILTKCV